MWAAKYSPTSESRHDLHRSRVGQRIGKWAVEHDQVVGVADPTWATSGGFERGEEQIESGARCHAFARAEFSAAGRGNRSPRIE